ncbi:hypothetical protein RB195_019424 [Necator americanus]|uniref:Uncharacterized protein n=1 Tax=Necator americanus TaxID=51031 RepID=A0ABR1CFV9_NECAM
MEERIDACSKGLEAFKRKHIAAIFFLNIGRNKFLQRITFKRQRISSPSYSPFFLKFFLLYSHLYRL